MLSRNGNYYFARKSNIIISCRIGVKSVRDCRYVNDIISANKTEEKAAATYDYCVGSYVGESRNATLNVSPWRERYLLAFRVFDIRNAHESWPGGTARSPEM